MPGCGAPESFDDVPPVEDVLVGHGSHRRREPEVARQVVVHHWYLLGMRGDHEISGAQLGLQPSRDLLHVGADVESGTRVALERADRADPRDRDDRSGRYPCPSRASQSGGGYEQSRAGHGDEVASGPVRLELRDDPTQHQRRRDQEHAERDPHERRVLPQALVVAALALDRPARHQLQQAAGSLVQGPQAALDLGVPALLANACLIHIEVRPEPVLEAVEVVEVDHQGRPVAPRIGPLGRLGLCVEDGPVPRGLRPEVVK